MLKLTVYEKLPMWKVWKHDKYLHKNIGEMKNHTRDLTYPICIQYS